MTKPSDDIATADEMPGISTVNLVSLGCAKNLIDSEKMLGSMAEAGLLPVADPDDADAMVINTCGFLEASKDESLELLREAAQRKESGALRRLIVAGCLVQRHRAKLLEWIPQIDAMVGVFDRDRIVEAVTGAQHTATDDMAVDIPVYSSIAGSAAVKKQRDKIEAAGYYESDAARLRLTPRHWAYLRISEGCNQNCAFCTIPSIRGKMRSKSIDAIKAEASELFADGAFELNLIGQDTTSYGQDIGYPAGLAGMLRELNTLAKRNNGAWLRLMYAYPSCFTDEMIEAIASLEHVVKYIDMPLQHINDRVLDSMRRKTSRKLIETLLDKLRAAMPAMAIRTTFISGYPGETEAEHRELVEFVRDFQFDAMGVFPYSPEPGTPAGRLHDQGGAIEPQIIDQRIEELMLTQQDVVFTRNDQWAQQELVMPTLIEHAIDGEQRAALDVIDDDAHWYEARTIRQAPEIDAVTYVRSESPLSPGELVDVRIVDWLNYDLIAEV